MRRFIRKYFKADYILLFFGLVLIIICLIVLFYDWDFINWVFYEPKQNVIR
jgi:hypothetical protein